MTTDSYLTTVHIAKDVEMFDRDALILDLKENPKHEAGKLIYCNVILHTLILSL